jgi:hypothetical protein
VSHMSRIEALKQGRTDWGCQGRHHGNGTPECPRELHHHHDDFCRRPTAQEMTAAGVTMPENGWRSRR